MRCPRTVLVCLIGSVSLVTGHDKARSVWLIARDKTLPVISNLSAGTPSASGTTITWTTNEPATSEVEYGPTAAYGFQLSLGARNRDTAHAITLTGLSPNTTYHFRAISEDKSGNRAVSPDSTFATAAIAPPADTTPPVISAVSAGTPTADTAVIQWATDEQATTQVEYGPTMAYGTVIPLDSSLVTLHSVTLAGLSPNTTYHFRAISADQSGNRAFSPDSSFATAAVAPPADTTPPVISAVSAGTPTADTAAIQWTTDEQATTQVEYGPTQAYGTLTTLDSSLVTSHSAALAGLSQSTTYHYRVLSRDAAGNAAASADATLTTAAAPTESRSAAVLDYASPFCQNGIPAAGYPWACGAWPSTTPPQLNAPGATMNDPDTGNRVLRVTAPGSQSQTSTASFFTNYSGWNHDWASDDSALIVRSWGGDGGKFWVGFDPTTMTLTGASGRIPDAFAGDNFAFDETDPDLIIGVQGSSIRTWNRKTLATTTLFPLTAVTSVHSLTAKGTRVCVNNGPQDGGYIIECFDRAAGTKQVIDLHQQTINGQPYTVWYKGGTTSHTGAGIHAITLGADGRWLATDLKSTPGCSALGLGTYSNQGAFFDLETGQVYAWSVACGQTHWAIGYGGFAAHGASAQWTADGFAQAGACPSDDDRGIITRTAGIEFDSSLSQLSCPPAPAMYGVGTHFSWQNNRDDANRNMYPLVGASLRTANNNAYLFNDIFAIQVNQASKSNKVWRFAQTWNDKQAANCDFLGWTSPTVSRSGKYVAFPSNWMGQTGSGSCTNGKRVDVFVFELK